ncbi:hypothetical protein BH18ACI4_BH18ACI4_22780 [soil metagenome]
MGKEYVDLLLAPFFLIDHFQKIRTAIWNKRGQVLHTGWCLRCV